MRLPLLVITAACAACACALPPPPAAPRPRTPGVLRVATWNVHDLFDAEDRTIPPGELDDVPSPEEVEAKVARVAAVLSRLDADLVLLQEVESLPLAEAVAARSGYPTARLVEAFDPRGIDVAALSRLPIGRYVSHLGERTLEGRPLWSRDCVEVHAEDGAPLVVVGTHLVSRLTDPVGERRREQAARLREIADAAGRSEPAALVLAGGDLNDEPGSASLAPLLADGEWVDPLAEAGASAWTWSGAAGSFRLDYLLLPRAEAWRVLGAEVVDGADVAAASDHRPVVLELRWGP